MVVIKTTSSYWDKTTRWPNLGNIDLWSQSGTYHQSDQGFQPHILVIDTTTSPSLASDVCSTCLPCCTSVWLSLSAVSVNHDHSPTHSKRHKLREMPDTPFKSLPPTLNFAAWNCFAFHPVGALRIFAPNLSGQEKDSRQDCSCGAMYGRCEG